jgi:hypothetical protein
VPADIELTDVVADDHRVAQQAVGLDAAPQGAFGGNQHRIGIDLEGGDAEFFKMRFPGAACRTYPKIPTGFERSCLLYLHNQIIIRSLTAG